MMSATTNPPALMPCSAGTAHSRSACITGNAFPAVIAVPISLPATIQLTHPPATPRRLSPFSPRFLAGAEFTLSSEAEQNPLNADAVVEV